MDMFSGDDFQEKVDLSNNDVSIAKGDWLHLDYIVGVFWDCSKPPKSINLGLIHRLTR